jgi:DNA-binding response OmpR family regulator
MHTPEPVSGTVLVVDREDRLPKTKAMLEGAGFDVLTAVTIEDGLHLARTQRPCLVLAEVMLEHPDAGFVLSYRLKSAPETAAIPVVLLSSVFRQTGMVFDLNTPEARQWIKADAYLEQPIAADRLLAKVRSLLHQN